MISVLYIALRGEDQKEGNGVSTRFYALSDYRVQDSLHPLMVSSGKKNKGIWVLTPRTAGSSCTFRRGCGGCCESSTDKSFTSEARKMMYAYGSCTGGMNCSGGLRRQLVRVEKCRFQENMVRRKATERSTWGYALSDSRAMLITSVLGSSGRKN